MNILNSQELPPILANNPQLDLIRFDFHDPGKLASLDWDGSDRAAVLPKLMAAQRVLRLTDNNDEAAKLLEQGFDSANGIAALPRSSFIAQVAPSLGEDGAAAARKIYGKASVIRSKTLHLATALETSALSPYFLALRSSPVPQATYDYFRDLPSYENMFGSLDYCDCQECRSVIGPAAYLVDLLRIIQERITAPSAIRASKGISKGIPDGLAFADRRGDILEIPLTCASTNQTVPYLQLVNKILSQHAGDFPLPTAATTFFPYNLPFNQPLSWITGLLGLKSWTLASLRHARSSDDASLQLIAQETLLRHARSSDDASLQLIAQETLGLSVEQASNLAPLPAGDSLANRLTANFGVLVTPFSVGGLNQVATFCAQTGFSPTQLRAILNQGLGTQEIMSLNGLTWSLGANDTLSLHQTDSDLKGSFVTTDAVGTLDGSLNANQANGMFKMAKDPKYGDKPSTGVFSFTIDYATGALSGSRTILDADKLSTVVPLNGTLSGGTMSAGAIAHQLFFNTSLDGRKFLHIEADKSNPVNPKDVIVGLDLKSLDRLNRLIRFARQLGWSEADLAWMALSLGIADFDADAVASLANVSSLSGLGLSNSDLAALWFDIKTIGRGNGPTSRTPFDVIFNAPERVDSGNGGELYRPTGAGVYPLGNGKSVTFDNPLYTNTPLPWIVHPPKADTISATAEQQSKWAQASAIVASIPLSGSDLVTLADALFITMDQHSKQVPVDLTVANLSALYRHAILSKALNLTVGDYLTLLSLLGMWQGKGNANSLRSASVKCLADFVSSLASLGASVADLAFICRGNPSPQVPVGYDEPALAAFRPALAQAMAASALTPGRLQAADMTGDQATRSWQALLDQGYMDNLGIVLAAINKTAQPDLSDVSPKLTDAQITYVIQAAKRALQAQTQRLVSQLATFLGTQEPLMGILLAGVCGTSSVCDPADLLLLTEVAQVEADKVLSGNSLDLTQARKLLLDKAGVTLPSDAQVREQSTNNKNNNWAIVSADGQLVFAYAQRLSNNPGQVRFLLPASAWPSTNGEPVPQNVAGLFQKIARYLHLSTLLNLNDADLGVLFQAPVTFTGDKTWADAFPSPQGVIVLGNYKALANQFNDRQGLLAAYFVAANQTGAKPEDLAKTLGDITGWDANGLATALADFCPGKICNTAILLGRLSQVFQASTDLGVRVSFLFKLLDTVKMPATNWAAYQEASDNLAQAVKGRFPADSWANVYRKFTGPILAASRDALVPMAVRQLAPSYPLSSARELSEFLLVDVEMSGCADISPIKLALNSCQHYLQRCRLNLEPGVVVSEDDIPGNWWEWIMEYRRWQANREIFIYPENYLDPSIRHDKTQLFRDLEASLAQGEVTAASVENAFTKYLDGFASLAKLVYVAGQHVMSHDPDSGAEGTLYLFARTPTKPYTYYYITQKPGQTWSEWVKITLTINNEAITPVYVFNRLFLFWVEQSSVERQQNDQTNNSIVTTATIYYSFVDFSGNWVQPQSLVSGMVTNVDSPSTQYGPFAKSLFDPSKPYFSRVQAVVTRASAYANLDQLSPSPAEIAEKLTIFYGPFIPIGEAPTASQSPWAPGGAGKSFAASLNAAIQAWKDSANAAKTGYLPVFPAITLDASLSPGFLLNEGELVLPLATPFTETSPGTPVFAWGSITTKLVAVDTDVALYQNYVEGMRLGKVELKLPAKAKDESFETPGLINEDASKGIFASLRSLKAIASDGKVSVEALKITVAELARDVKINKTQAISLTQARAVKSKLAQLYWGSAVLFGKTARKGTSVTPVSNQPGYAIVSVPEESFLVSVPSAGLKRLDEGLSLRRPYAVINESTFVSDYFNKEQSKFIYDSLKSTSGFLSNLDVVDLTKAAETDLDRYKSILSSSSNNKSPNKGNDELDPSLAALLVKDILLRQGPTGLLYTASVPPDNIIYNLPYYVNRLTTGAVEELSRALFTGGIDALLSLSSQGRPAAIRLPFSRLEPNANLIKQGPSTRYANQVDFEGPYKLYYRELFFYAPTLVAQALRNNNQFQDSQRWLQYVFNPTVPPHPVTAADLEVANIGKPRALVIFKALVDNGLIGRENGMVAPKATSLSVSDFASACGLTPGKPADMADAEAVQNVLVNLYLPTPSARFWQFLKLRDHTVASLRQNFQDNDAIDHYENDPFDPHAIAQLRIGAYAKWTVMAYIENLIQWGDLNFSAYTWESVATASLLYRYAYDLLGPKPVDVGPCSRQFPVDFNDIATRYANDADGIPQFLIDMEHFVQNGAVSPPNRPDHPYNDLGTYFCVPENKVFAGYWDTVEDRLAKIRHCQNIDGQSVSLAMWEPPIDPMAMAIAMAQAAASGGSLDAASYQQANVPAYRFQVMVGRAKELASLVAQFGGSLLAALEKKDSEALQLMRAQQENLILDMTTLVRQKAIEDLQDQIAAQTEALNNANYRQKYYQDLLRQGINAYETANLTLMANAMVPQALSMGIHGVSIAAYLLPNIFGLADGGMQFGEAVNATAAIADGTAAMLNQAASLTSTMNEYIRRAEDWTFQKNNARSDIQRLASELEAAKVRLASSQRELAIHMKSIQQGKDVETVLRTHFASQDLYQWMISRMSGLYYQAYRLALATAVIAQAAYRFETDRDDNFISFGYWDTLNKGLLAGEALDLSIRQMESAYDTYTPRRLEIEKTVSLSRLFPQEFQKFKWGPDGSGGQGRGVLNFSLSQALYDFDFPGHYCRKIHSISLSIPAVVGPYQNIHATLTQTGNFTALTPNGDVVKWLVERTVDGKAAEPQPAASVLRQNWVPYQQVALSRGVDEAGLFTLESNDPRYLPFEGTGAVSTWTLSLPVDTNRINFDSITDVLVTVRYTAKDGGREFSKQVRDIYRNAPPSFNWIEGKTVELALAVPAAWQNLLASPADPGTHRRISFPVTDGSFLVNMSAVKLLKVSVQLELADSTHVINTTGSKDFLSIQFDASQPSEAMDIVNNVATPQRLPTSLPSTSNVAWTLGFDPALYPPGLFKPASSQRLVNLSVSIIFVGSAFSR